MSSAERAKMFAESRHNHLLLLGFKVSNKLHKKKEKEKQIQQLKLKFSIKRSCNQLGGKGGKEWRRTGLSARTSLPT